MGEPAVVTLRATRDTDLDTLHRITHEAGHGPDHDPGDDLEWRTVRADGEIVGRVTSRREGGDVFVAVSLPPSASEAVGVRALRLFADTLPRPLHAKVAAADEASAAMLEHCGFRRVDAGLYRLD
ncbi:RimJ/RimL family protein N-acetyltransferase [Agromyces terreus]|uniref:RimJ/RimL family protein N-acetyltransferase n=1 Tax=Agromyces terreus TaxID=424795 RepID=A0A9X2GYR8_9MICO|nr:hypothetical protein [Agromyces terreus]MCP2371550.1 RimJ/RimL family protein N-acetyltransferase [Agromyces terreus]